MAGEYDEEEITAAASESTMDSMAVPIYGNVFSGDHGELLCIVQCFENVVELNFVLEDGVGTAVAIDVEAMVDTSGLVAEAQQIIREERT